MFLESLTTSEVYVISELRPELSAISKPCLELPTISEPCLHGRLGE